MTTLASLPPTFRVPYPMTRYGEALRERREYVGFPTATACALKSSELERSDPANFKKFSQSSLSRWELDRTGELIEAAHGKSLRTLAYLLKWNRVEFTHNVGVPVGNVPFLDPQPRSGDNFLDRVGEAVQLAIPIPDYGSVAAGIVGFEMSEHPLRYVHYSREEIPDGIEDLSRLYLVRANGDSMFQEGMKRPVPDGALLLVEAGALPQDGDVVLAYIEERELGVVKEYWTEDDAVLLRSYRKGGPTFWSSDYPSMRIVGVVRRVTYTPGKGR